MKYFIICAYIALVYVATFFGLNFILRVFEINYDLTVIRAVGLVAMFCIARFIRSFIFCMNHYEEQLKMNELKSENDSLKVRGNDLVNIVCAIVKNNDGEVRVPYHVTRNVKDLDVKVAHTFDYATQEDIFKVVEGDNK